MRRFRPGRTPAWDVRWPAPGQGPRTRPQGARRVRPAVRIVGWSFGYAPERKKGEDGALRPITSDATCLAIFPVARARYSWPFRARLSRPASSVVAGAGEAHGLPCFILVLVVPDDHVVPEALAEAEHEPRVAAGGARPRFGDT